MEPTVDNINGKPIVNSMIESTVNDKNNFQSIQNELKTISDQYNEIESLIISKDSSVNSSMEDLLESLKTISYNQTVLENKLEDALKNQMNTDVLVNDINERLNKISKKISNLPLTSSSSTNHVNNQFDNINTNNDYHSSSLSSKRGPGRPRKDNSTINYSNNSNSTSNDNVKALLPTGSVHISKSKRYFIDPSSNTNSIPSSASSSTAAATSISTSANLASRKRRGRPPKKRTVDTVIINGEGEDVKSMQRDTFTSLPSEYDDDKDEIIKDEIEDENQDSRDESQENDYEIEDIDDNGIANIDNNSKIDIHLQTVDSMSQAIESKTKVTKPEINRQQRELEKLRDPRERMLVNMKYNDRDRAKSFMRSNQKLLMAMKEEERRRRMTAVTFQNENQNSMESSVKPTLTSDDSTTEINNDTALATPITNEDPSTKFGISTILNSEETAIVGEDPQNELNITSPGTENTNTMDSSINLKKRGRSDSLTFKVSNGDVIEPIPPIENDAVSDENPIKIFRKRKLLSSSPAISGMSSSKTTPISSAGHEITNVLPIINRTFNHFKKNNLDSDASLIHRNAINSTTASDYQTTLLLGSPIELVCKDGFFFRRNVPNVPITSGSYLEFRFLTKEKDLIKANEDEMKRDKDSGFLVATLTKHDRTNTHFLKPDVSKETELAFDILCKTTLTEKYVNSLEYFLMEFRWENKLVGLGLKLRESKRTWQRRKALFALFEFWRDQSQEKRGFKNFTILHAVKEMENYRIFINRSVSWFYNHITLLKMILYDLCDNVATQWREWMFQKSAKLPNLGDILEDGTTVTMDNINEALDNLLVFDFLDDGTQNNEIKSSKVIVPRHK